jgi:predicted transcriptional regulator of viral defense system
VNIYQIRDRIAASGNPIVTNRLISVIAGVSIGSSQVYLNRMLKAGMLTHVERGRYAMHADPYAVASNIVFPSYISFVTAFSINQLIDQVIDRIFLVTSLKRRGASVQGHPVRFVSVKPKLIFGYRKIMRGGYQAFIAENEKAVLDTLYMPRYGRLNQLLGIISESVDPDKLVKWCKLFAVEAVTRRTGYLLDLLGIENQLKPASRIPYLLNPAMGRTGKMDRKWLLYINDELA